MYYQSKPTGLTCSFPAGHRAS